MVVVGEGGPLNNNNSGTGVYKIITLIIDIVGEKTNNKNYRTCNKHSNTKVISALYYLSMIFLRRLILKPRTDLYVFIFGEREFQTDGPEKAKLVL